MTFSPALADAQPGAGRMVSAIPDSPAGRAVDDLVRAFNAGQLRDPRWLRWRQLVGVVVFRGAEEVVGGGLRAWVQGTISHGWLGWEVVPDSGGQVDRSRVPVFWLGGGPPPGLAKRGAVTRDPREAGRAIVAYLDSLARADLFSGVVVVAYRGAPIVQRAYGFANRAYGVRNGLDTRFPVASVGKVFTALAIARLVAAGKVSYDDPIERFLPDYPIVEARRATVGQLLAHQAGLGPSPMDWIAMREQVALAELVRLTAAPQRFIPGTSTQYSNEAYLVAGRTVEVVSGLPYETFVEREVLVPAGLTSTDWDTIDHPTSRRAVPYSNWRFVYGGGQQFLPGERRDVTIMQGLKGTPAGGAYTTADDLLAFATALTFGKVIDSARVAELFTPRGSRPGGRSGYGFELTDSPRVASKGGNTQGASAQLDIYLDDGYTVVVLSNYDQAAQVAAQGIRDLLRRDGLQGPARD